MPEEVNRVLTDRLSDLLLTPVEEAMENIAREGLTDVRTEFVGNVMIDAMLGVLPKARQLGMPARLGVTPGDYVLATLHRPSNVDEPERLALLLETLARIAERRPVVFPMHPRTRARAEGGPLDGLLRKLIVTEPFGYAEMVGALDGAAAAVTDSGGVQQETTVLGVPCVTMRAQTEWSSTLTLGTNRLVAWPPSVAGVVRDVEDAIARGRVPLGAASPAGWDGRAAARIVTALSRA
jgi:UDP-N-acetylglucosamine 2-epimerase (non-hydrolysing)